VETAADGKSGRGSARGNGFRREREAREIRKFLGLPGAPTVANSSPPLSRETILGYPMV
jgi:hypothetical protein